MNAAIFLDRDNTLIFSEGDVADPSQVRLLQGVPSAIASLRGLGYKIIVVTNQDGIANGRYTEQAADAVHMKINEQIGSISGTSIDRFYYCPFNPDAILERYRKDHPWRKPNPGMILQAAKDLDIDPLASWIISTDPLDIKTGYAAGVRTMLLTPKAQDMIPLKMEEIFIQQTRALMAKELDGPYFSARNLVEAVRVIAQQRRPDFPEERVVRDRFGRKIVAGDEKPKPQFQAQMPSPLFTSTEPEPEAPASPQAAQAPVAALETPSVLAFEPAAPEPQPVPVAPAPEPIVIPSPDLNPAMAPAVEREPMLIPMSQAQDDVNEDDESTVPAASANEAPPQEPLFTQAQEAQADPAPVTSAPASPAKAQSGPKSAPAPLPAPTEEVEIEKLPPVEVQFQRMESSLRLILHEIRSSKEVVHEMSFTTIIGLILQALSIILLAGAMFQPGDGFTRWVGCAIVLQLASITAVLIKR
jgi:D,D-heptose 1,7-bisphosphate phosphatase